MSERQPPDPSQQTHEEWWNDYDRASGGGFRTGPAQPVVDPHTVLFRYLDHRTTTKGSVALEFESLDAAIRATRFFNVSLRSSRGRGYPAGKRGQFIPPKRGKFRRFWMQAVGQEPSSWCRIHKSMRSQLGSIVFVGIAERATDGKRQPYFRMTEVHAQKHEQ